MLIEHTMLIVACSRTDHMQKLPCYNRCSLFFADFRFLWRVSKTPLLLPLYWQLHVVKSNLIRIQIESFCWTCCSQVICAVSLRMASPGCHINATLTLCIVNVGAYGVAFHHNILWGLNSQVLKHKEVKHKHWQRYLVQIRSQQKRQCAKYTL